MKLLGKGFGKLRDKRLDNKPTLKSIKEFVRRKVGEMGCDLRYIDLCIKQNLINKGINDTRLTIYANWFLVYNLILNGNLKIQSQFK